uniref:Uncharacterized protein n=1 Tax=Branchiostoma floridae TaxID=7739 RepID=C3YXK6_BRAFL|eukprot:XP_002598803.1 hypothetical protein BRAFLDRAFT_74520 [Branchiostoma floridae]
MAAPGDNFSSPTAESSHRKTGSHKTAPKDFRKKKKPKPKPVTEVRVDRSVISKLHVLNKELDTIRSDQSLSQGTKQARVNQLETEIQKIGGLDAYQAASKRGACCHGNTTTSNWVIKQLKKFKVKPASEKTRLRLLDVGALDNHYQRHGWLDCTAIDLNPQTHRVTKADFFDYQVVLPLPCLSNSRYLTQQLFSDMLDSLGFQKLGCHDSKRLSFLMFQRTGKRRSKSFPKQVVRTGPSHNNFSIVL